MIFLLQYYRNLKRRNLVQGGSLNTIPVANWEVFPKDLFAAAPELPPCGSNNNASRTWVLIYNQDGTRLYGFCGLEDPSNLQNIWVSTPVDDQCIITGLYIEIWDRACNLTYISNILNIAQCSNEGNANYTEDALNDCGCQICDDGIQNGDEEGIDCGGTLCEPCSIGCPDLIVEHLEVSSLNLDGTSNSIRYDFIIKNIGAVPAPLDGPTAENYDNISVQAFLSGDTIFNNGDDSAAGGTILGLSPLGELAINGTFSGNFGAGGPFNPYKRPYLILKVDWGERLTECNEDNNTLVVRIPSRFFPQCDEDPLDVLWLQDTLNQLTATYCPDVFCLAFPATYFLEVIQYENLIEIKRFACQNGARDFYDCNGNLILFLRIIL